MNDEIIPILKKIMRDERADLTQDHQALEEALRFNARKMRVETNLLCAAAKVNVPRTLMRKHSKSSHAKMVERLANRLSRDFCMLDEAALWAVLSWAKCLEIPLDIDEDELLALLTPESDMPNETSAGSQSPSSGPVPSSADSQGADPADANGDENDEEELVELKAQDLPPRRRKNGLLPDEFFSNDERDDRYSTEQLPPLKSEPDKTQETTQATAGKGESEKSQAHEPHEVVEFMDPVFEQCILESLQRERITYGEAKDVRKLEVCNRAVTSLEGLQAFSGLRYLDIRHNKVSDISPVSALEELEVLLIDYNLVEDLKPLAGLCKLSKISAHSNLVKNIVPLVTLFRKGVFDPSAMITLSGNPLSDDAKSVHIKILREKNINVVVSR